MTIQRKPILVTGSHRSGTTWTGQILAKAPCTTYIHEPFNINTPIPTENFFEYWFQYVCEENAYRYQKELVELIGLNYPLREPRNFEEL